MNTILEPGAKAPDFTAKDQDSNTISLKAFKGKKVVLCFYPRDNTPSCTAQACNIRDNYALLQKEGIVILGVSTDNEKSHKRFEKKFNLPFPLLADTDMTIAEAYGVWGLKKFMGREFMGIRRTTFLINEKGKIEHIIDKVTTKDHAAQILALWK